MALFDIASGVDDRYVDVFVTVAVKFHQLSSTLFRNLKDIVFERMAEVEEWLNTQR